MLTPKDFNGNHTQVDENVEKVIAAADKAWTASKSSAGTSTALVSAVSGSNTGAPVRGAKQGRGRRQQGQRSVMKTTTVTLCTFHKKYGDAARRCTPACSRWNEQRPRDAPPARVFQVEEALDGEDAQEDTASGNE